MSDGEIGWGIMRRKKLFYQIVGWLALLAMTACWLAAAMILLARLNTWLRHIDWTSQTAAEHVKDPVPRKLADTWRARVACGSV